MWNTFNLTNVYYHVWIPTSTGIAQQSTDRSRCCKISTEKYWNYTDLNILFGLWSIWLNNNGCRAAKNRDGIKYKYYSNRKLFALFVHLYIHT